MFETFQNILWGYELKYRASWIHQPVQDADAFMATPAALDPDYVGEDAGHLLVRGEWNWRRQPVEPLWNEQMGRLAGLLGAREIGSAPWNINGAEGLEAEIVLPKKENRRLWIGILIKDFRVLQFMATHPMGVRPQFEPAATEIISSLRFPKQISGIMANQDGIPLPPSYAAVDPTRILTDIPDPENWRAYTGGAGIGALQAFYLREAVNHKWHMEEYVAFPSSAKLGFARFQLQKENLKVMLGIMPYDPSGAITASSRANIVYKLASG